MTKPVLKLHNTLTREKQTFTPINADNVGLYVCGVTPYDDSHIGHARVYVVFDVLYRLLKHLYPKVTYVRNFTDVDDKIIQRANEVGQNPVDVAAKYIQSYYEDMDALNVLRPTYEPRVSSSIHGIVKMVDDLINGGFAYLTASGDVMFDVVKFEKNSLHHPFGYLARRSFDKLQARIDEDREKLDPRDFPIWKANDKSSTKMEQAYQPSHFREAQSPLPFDTLGRPGWHIECSVMSKQHLGPTFDIHGGGEDLQFPHHCCEIAQSEALLPPNTNMANYWLHNGFITVNGTKMSKSLGNFTTIKQALQKYSPEAIRLWLLQTHYRKPVDYSDEALKACEVAITRIRSVLITARLNNAQLVSKVEEESIRSAMAEMLLNDLDNSKLLAHLFSVVDVLRSQHLAAPPTPLIMNDAFSTTITLLDLLGIPLTLSKVDEWVGNIKSIDESAHKLIEERLAARFRKDWKESDRLRDALKALGIEVMDGPTGQTWRRL